jgi:hypothetical protein
VLRHQQPQPQEIARDLLGQPLAHVPFQALLVDANLSVILAGALSQQQGGRVLAAGVELIEFLLEAVVGDDPSDRPETDLEVGLAQCLGDIRARDLQPTRRAGESDA